MMTITKRAYFLMLIANILLILISLDSILAAHGVITSGLPARPAQPGVIACQFEMKDEKFAVVLQSYERYLVCSIDKLPVVCQQAVADSFHPKGSQTKQVEKHLGVHGSQLVVVIREYY